MKIISWNVNSVNTRLEHLLHMLQNVQPDFVCLQEIKCENARFPTEQITAWLPLQKRKRKPSALPPG